MRSMNPTLPKIILPALLFGYAAFANAAVFLDLGRNGKIDAPATESLLDGKITQEIDSVYKTELPHRDTSVGLIGAARYLAFGEGRKGVIVGKDKWLFSDEEFQAPAKPDTYIDAAAARIVAVRDELAVRGVKLVVVPLPGKVDLYRAELDEQTIPTSIELRYAAFRSALGAKGVETVDARAALIEGKQHGQVFLKTDTHWTPFGAASVAAAIGRALPDFAGTSDFTVAETGPVDVQGDLTKFITEGSYSRLVGFAPERIALRQATKAAGTEEVGDIFGNDAAIPVALVGTSYSANENWGFVEDLRAALRSDVLNVAEAGRGPVYPMMKYLKSDSLKNAAPKLLLWEFPVRYLAQAHLWDDTVSDSSTAGQSVSATPAAGSTPQGSL